jgi:hypothetical protein
MSNPLDPKIIDFLEKLKISFNSGSLNRIKISKPSQKSSDLLEVILRPVKIKNSPKLSFVYHYKTKDITKNFDLEEAIEQITELLGTQFKNFMLFTNENDIRLSFTKKIKPMIHYGKPTSSCCTVKTHDKVKNHFIKVENNVYLKELGVVTSNDQIAKDKGSKYKQIAKFIETLDRIIKDSNISDSGEVRVADMGSGKGYLTFAVYDHLVNNLKLEAQVTGVEMRENLVSICNQVADKSSFKNLKFVQNTINDYPVDKVDMLIALHACDTATDDAIFKGISANSSIIVLSPCCHKQIRKELNVSNELSDIVKHGILKERMAETVTDSMRGLMLEAFGYKTQIFEFISDSHTHKNLMIVGIKKGNEKVDQTSIEKLQNMKKMFGIGYFYLEELLKEKINS